MLPDQDVPADNPGYEVRDTNIRSIIIFAAGLMVALLVAQVSLWAFLKGLNGSTPEPRASLSMPPMADREYNTLREQENVILGKSAWVDKDAGKVRIPIDRAIELLSERGLSPTGAGKTEADMNSHSGGKSAEPMPVEGEKK